VIEPVLYLPIEETRRELASRLLLGCLAAERGLAVVFGQQWLITHNLSRMPRGLVLFKGNDTIQRDNMALCKRLGHMTASFEEEMFGVCTQSQILRLYTSDVDQVCDLFLAQGALQRDALLARWPSITDRIAVVGNPRADVLRDEFLATHREAAREIGARHGRFILINTNFGTVNAAAGNALDSYDGCARQGLMDATTAEGRADFNTWCEWERLNFAAVVRFVDWVEANLPDVAIILRPHPSENPRFWERGFGGRPRVRVESAGVFIPWLLASEMLVHTGCTTGLEAFLMDHPAISLTPPGTRWHEHYVANLINPAFADVAEAGAFVAAELAGSGGIAAMRPRFSTICDHHLASTGPHLSAERTLAALLPRFGDFRRATWSPGPGFVTGRERMARQQAKMNADLGEVEVELRFFTRTLGRFADLGVRAVGEALFCIDPMRQ
jgi:surface carbohydrate biosynthesis protein